MGRESSEQPYVKRYGENDSPGEKHSEGATLIERLNDASQDTTVLDYGEHWNLHAEAADRIEELERELASMTDARNCCMRTMNEAIEENTRLRSAIGERWIPVSERMPESGEVLAYHRQGYSVKPAGALINDERNGGGFYIAWMQLPLYAAPDNRSDTVHDIPKFLRRGTD
jgi:hypothetical protein